MKKKTNAEAKKLPFDEKTRLFSSKPGQDFPLNFFSLEQVNEIITNVFDNILLENPEELRSSLNHVLNYCGQFFPDFICKTPGKPDEIKLMQEIKKNGEELERLLKILWGKYGYETWKHLPVYSPNWQKLDTGPFLEKLIKELHSFVICFPMAIENIKKNTGKKRGNNAQSALTPLIDGLIDVYEGATGKSANENFIQDRSRKTLSSSKTSLKYKGQFYEFVHTVLKIINQNYQTKFSSYPRIFRVNLDKDSLSLGQHIRKVFKSRREQTEKEIVPL